MYEVWLRDEYNRPNEEPLEKCAVLDSAIEKVRELSKTATTEDGAPLVYGVIDRTGSKSTVRGVAIAGKWRWSVDCKKCFKTGCLDGWRSKGPCPACQGAGWNPDRS